MLAGVGVVLTPVALGRFLAFVSCKTLTDGWLKLVIVLVITL
jgi:hypothetical protein